VLNPDQMVEQVRAALEERKAEDLRILDVRGLSALTDYFVLATGLNVPHLKAMVGDLSRRLKGEGIRAAHHSGDPESGWLVYDFTDVVVHLFLRDVREFYGLEQLWSDAREVRGEPGENAGEGSESR
jgi:ribosome-associated protein